MQGLLLSLSASLLTTTTDALSANNFLYSDPGVAKRNLTIIGVHTPETDEERVTENVVRRVKQMGITYPVLDLFFSAEAVHTAEKPAIEEVTAVHWINPAEVDPGSLAFPSMQFAFRRWLAAGTRPTN